MVAPAAALGGISALTEGLKKAGVQTAIKQFSKSMSSMEKTTKLGGMDAFRDGMDKMSTFAANFQPIAVPFQMMTAQITAETMGTNIELMTAWMELMGSDLSQTAMQGWIDFINGWNEFATAWTTGVKNIFDRIFNNIDERARATQDLFDEQEAKRRAALGIVGGGGAGGSIFGTDDFGAGILAGAISVLGLDLTGGGGGTGGSRSGYQEFG